MNSEQWKIKNRLLFKAAVEELGFTLGKKCDYDGVESYTICTRPRMPWSSKKVILEIKGEEGRAYGMPVTVAKIVDLYNVIHDDPMRLTYTFVSDDPRNTDILDELSLQGIFSGKRD